MYIYLPALVCLVGLLMYLFVDGAKYPKAVDIGKVMFWTGLLAFMLTYHGGGPSLSIR
jgi:hypothetical protein